jgi:hypothetical protein
MLRKKTDFFLSIVFLVSLVFIALDPHPGDCVASTCPICEAKSSLGNAIHHEVMLSPYDESHTYPFTASPQPAIASLVYSSPQTIFSRPDKELVLNLSLLFSEV